MKSVKEFYWKTLEQNSLSDSHLAEKFEQALILLDLEETEANLQIQENENLKQMFGFQPQYLNIIEESSEESSQEKDETDTSSEEDVITETLRMDKAPFKDEGTTSGTKDQNSQSPEKQSSKGQKRSREDFYPPSTEFRINQSGFGSNTLYLDCKVDRKKLIDIWAKEMSLIIQTNPTQYTDHKTVLLLLDHKTAGSVNKFVRETDWPHQLEPIDSFNKTLDGIYAMFLGIDYVSSKISEQNKVIENAKITLSKMQLCDICHLERFYCEYEKNLYDTGDQRTYESYIKEYMRKIPLVGEKALARFITEKSVVTRFSLAFAHKIVKEEIAQVCDLTKKQKQLKAFSRNCCKKLTEEVFTYGCTPQYKHKKKYSKKKTSKYRFKKKQRSFKPGKFVKKKTDFQKKKFCPKGKKNCRCWVCNEEGHYANECPNRKQNLEKNKVLEEILSLGFEPIEDEYEGLKNVLIIEIDPGDETGSSEDESSSESN